MTINKAGHSLSNANLNYLEKRLSKLFDVLQNCYFYYQYSCYTPNILKTLYITNIWSGQRLITLWWQKATFTFTQIQPQTNDNLAELTKTRMWEEIGLNQQIGCKSFSNWLTSWLSCEYELGYMRHIIMGYMDQSGIQREHTFPTVEDGMALYRARRAKCNVS